MCPESHTEARSVFISTVLMLVEKQLTFSDLKLQQITQHILDCCNDRQEKSITSKTYEALRGLCALAELLGYLELA